MKANTLFSLSKKTNLPIKKQFLFNYTVLFVILFFIGVITLIANTIYVESMYEDIDEAFLKKLYHDGEKKGLEAAFKEHELPDHAYLEFLNKDYKITQQYNSPHEIGHQYELRKFLKEIDHYDTDLFIPDDGGDYLVLYLPVERFFLDVFLFTVLFFLICLIIILRWYVKRTSTQFIQPVEKLLSGIDSIAQGNYDTNIHFQANQELNDLKENINRMAVKIGEEITLKERSEHLRKQLILDISHDLKTPLTNIQGYAETLWKFPSLTHEERQQYSSIIMTNSTKANRLIQDLFDLSHLDMETNKQPFEEHNLTELVRDIFTSFVDELEAKGIHYEVEIPDCRLMMKMDIHLFERAITNLLQNCITHGGNHLALSLTKERHHVVLTIADKGTGIPKEYHDKIFEPFVRVDESRNTYTGGTGLGLAIAKKIITKQNGTITIDPNYTQGCRFVITLGG
ncbi:Alkaline phosphatase synthesis sensor protein PhoR [Bacillus sp. THAF10]|uniref:sensor histidine kinase n=1 Tax=Bacillus sp. THAF10 TaxID=2587848 RepID=UPI001267D8D9|nr:HAMP domain-containing sensor histidine kinase [Bacillus sp. THAF10]QFT90780.1 Alkaline phosphatase synthesis sensor protein PhoR [Bacillus sp. THAF10]